MDRDTIEEYLIDGLIPIIQDEIKYLKSKKVAFESPLMNIIEKYSSNRNNNLQSLDKKEFSRELGMICYMYDYHKLECKKGTGDKSIKIDRHKIAAIFLCAIVDYKPIRKILISEDVGENEKVEIRVINYRIAFRFACYYARIALFHTFVDKSTDEDKINSSIDYEDTNTIETYKHAKDIMQKKHLYPYFPMTRPALDKYMDNYVNVLYLYINEIKELNVRLPYLLIADTFYLLDVYTKLKLGISVPSEDYKEKGLAHFSKVDEECCTSTEK